MNIKHAVCPESFKLVSGKKNIFRDDMLDSMPKTISLSSPRGSCAAFELLLSADCDFILSVSDSPYFSQHGQLPVLRVACDSPFKTTVRIAGMLPDDDRLYRADPLLKKEATEIQRGEPVCVYIELDVGGDAPVGASLCRLRVMEHTMFSDEKEVVSADLPMEVFSYTLPPLTECGFQLDIWQHNSNLARHADTPLWSDGHFAIMERYVASLARLGAKSVTIIASDTPWSGQWCHLEKRADANLYEYSIITSERAADGSFSYDFSKMQRYIDLCAKYGIDGEISLYGLVNVWCDGLGGFQPVCSDYPDGLKVRYLDRADGCYKYMKQAQEIENYIRAIEDYFIRTSQIDRVRITADEPADPDAYRVMLDRLKKLAPAFHYKAAINHSEFVGRFGNEISDFVPSLKSWSHEYAQLAEYKRAMPDKKFLWYVCNEPDYPNAFLRSELCELYFIGVLSAYLGTDGFLRWDYTVWTENPLEDIRYFNWPAGDLCFVYPGSDGSPVLSLRYAALYRAMELCALLRELKTQVGTDAIETAAAFVLREKDVSKYFDGDRELPLEKICSTDYADYDRLRRYALTRLSENQN